MVPARVVDSLASALRGRRSTLSYAGVIGVGEEDRTPGLGFTKTLHFRRAMPARKFTNGRDQPGQKRSLPETTVCRPTEGDQYRISGPSYVLAGTAILNSKKLHVITRPHDARGFPLAEFG
jgi:hypothetical protein